MDDNLRIIQTLQAALLRRLGSEVDLIFLYGSTLKGTTHTYSDLDISFVPVHDETWESITVMVGERLVDLYPMHWSLLERMAAFDDLSATVLLENRILYQRSPEAGARFSELTEQLRALQELAARPAMVRKALEIFQRTGYPYYLLHQQAAEDHVLGCMQQAQSILRIVLHCLAVCNQAPIDTRKMIQVLRLPLLPPDLEGMVERLNTANSAAEILPACETLLHKTHEVLVCEQRKILQTPTTFAEALDAAYPELKRDLQAVMLGCERQDVRSLRGSYLSLHHELSRALAQVQTSVEYTGFNGLADYELDLTDLGFPALVPSLLTGDYAELQRQCVRFDQRLKEFLTENAVALNQFATVDDLELFLEKSD